MVSVVAPNKLGGICCSFEQIMKNISEAGWQRVCLCCSGISLSLPVLVYSLFVLLDVIILPFCWWSAG